ncbi:LytTR family DNA-binding domain-containing protein [Kordia sp.]|uniref:LytR/AlgR family response regulator transcription factor n=1 Tax=Kordia sp. TaxID=1965332 RepID=UPI0025C4A05F|nr:LytTR family DNA-binding domain-containing protein [Kordia sp.]MCH2194961.1 LytTR family transcriptional regulator [Kordia sp.]
MIVIKDKKNIKKALQNNENYLLVGTKNQGEYLKKSQILYMEASECYSWIYLIDGSKVISCKAIGYYQELFLDMNFSRIHRSYLINLSHLKLYEPRYRLVHLKGDIVLPVSHRKNRAISKMIHNQKSNTPFKMAV